MEGENSHTNKQQGSRVLAFKRGNYLPEAGSSDASRYLQASEELGRAEFKWLDRCASTMDLTPIHIPRKSNRDFGKAALAARKALNKPHRRGRPLKAASDLRKGHLDGSPSRPLSIEPKKRSLKNLKSRRKMSVLEKLPTELLQQIFLYCLNLDLPRSSPVIAGKLSSSSMYSRAIVAAFSPTWNAWHGKNRNRRLEKDLSGGDVALQSAILRCRWATLDVLLEAKDAWLQSCPEPRPYLPLYFSRELGVGSQTSNGEPPIPTTAKEYLDIDFAAFCAFAEEIDGPSVWHTCSWDRNTDIADGVELPITLLSGPWTDDMVKYLFWLVKSGAQIDWYTSTLGEVGMTGLRTAIMDGNIRALHLLEWAGLIAKLDMDTLIWAIQNAGGTKIAVVNHLLRIGFSLLSDPDARKLGRALSDLRDEAMAEDDQEKLDYFFDIRRSRTLRDITNLHV